MCTCHRVLCRENVLLKSLFLNLFLMTLNVEFVVFGWCFHDPKISFVGCQSDPCWCISGTEIFASMCIAWSLSALSFMLSVLVFLRVKCRGTNTSTCFNGVNCTTCIEVPLSLLRLNEIVFTYWQISSLLFTYMYKDTYVWLMRRLESAIEGSCSMFKKQIFFLYDWTSMF